MGKYRGAPNLAPLLPLSAKMDLIRLTTYHWQPYVSKLRVIRKVLLSKSKRCLIRTEHTLQDILQLDDFFAE